MSIAALLAGFAAVVSGSQQLSPKLLREPPRMRFVPALSLGGPQESAARRLVGMTEAAAVRRAESHGWTLRVIRRDGRALMLTLDRLPSRVNVVVRDGRVARVDGFY